MNVSPGDALDRVGSLASGRSVLAVGEESKMLGMPERLPPAVTVGRTLVGIWLLGTAACGGGGSGDGGNDRLPSNQPPHASAGPDQTVLEGSSVTLSATSSSDTDGRIARSAWTQTGGPSVTLATTSPGSATFSAPFTDTHLTLSFQLTVTDDRGATASDDIAVLVDPSHPPSANAGPDQMVAEREQVVLSASRSTDVDGAIATYSWVQTAGPPMSLSDPNALDTTFTAPATDSPIELAFELTVIDDTHDRGSDTATVTILPNEPPQLVATYPCDGCRFHGDSISVVGAAIPGFDLPEVARRDAVSVMVDAGAGSTPAMVLAGEFWIALNVPVDSSRPRLTVTLTATDRFGETAQAALELEQRPTITSAVMAPDPVRAGLLYLLESANPRPRLFELDLGTGAIRVAFELSTNRGNLVGVAVDPTNNRLLAVSHLVTAMDLSTGAITTISGGGIGSGPSLSIPESMALNADRQQLLVVDTNQGLMAVDLVSGERTVLADDDPSGPEPPLIGPLSVAVDSSAQLAYVAGSIGHIMSVDLSTGHRAALAPSQPLPDFPFSIDLDAGRGNLVLWSTEDDSLITVEPASGLVSVLSAADGSGLSVGSAPEVRVDALGDRYLVNDLSPRSSSNDTDALISIDPMSGARELLHQDAVGTGPRLRSVRNVAVDPFSNRVYVVEQQHGLLSINVSGGDRSVVSGPSRGAGPAFTTPIDLALNLDDGFAYVLDLGETPASVLAVHLKTGNRSLISGPLAGTGPSLSDPTAIVFDAANDRLLVADDHQAAIVSVDLATGNRAVFADARDGVTPFENSTGMDLDLSGNRLIVADGGSDAPTDGRIFGIDLTTGIRTVLDEPGGPPPLVSDTFDVAALEGTDVWIVATGGSLMLIDGETRERLVLARSDVGTGESVTSIYKVALDPVRLVLYAWSAEFEALFQFSILMGDRVVVSK